MASRTVFPRVAMFALVLPAAQAMRTYKEGREGREAFNLSVASTTCAGLTNKGSYFTVKVQVGTPPQEFDFIADTGSDSFIVKSCDCVEKSKSCEVGAGCYRGKFHSETFSIREKPDAMQLKFGNGPIDTVVASDVVQVGDAYVHMEDSMLLMVSKKLNFHEDLQGVLGLGLPSFDTSKKENDRGRGFMDMAMVNRFSMCFSNQGATDGVLRLGQGVALPKPMGTIGKKHWTLDFRGVSIGNSAFKGAPSFCAENLKGGKGTGCAAVIDSGSSLIMAPAKHMVALFAQLCDAWPLCQQHPSLVDNGPKDDAKTKEVKKVKTFLSEAGKCVGLDLLPNLQFHVRGAAGNQETLELAPREYMVETQVNKTRKIKNWLFGMIPYESEVESGDKDTVCVPAFHTHKYRTEANGPAWIFGAPFFYKYTVGYDRASTPPSISFNQERCSSCGTDEFASVLTEDEGRRTQLRRLTDEGANVMLLSEAMSLHAEESL